MITLRKKPVAWAAGAVVLGAVLAGAVHFVQVETDRRWRDFVEAFQRVPLPETTQAISEQVDFAFVPVYDSIGPLLDWRYTLRGRVTVRISALAESPAVWLEKIPGGRMVTERIASLIGASWIPGLDGRLDEILFERLQERVGVARQEVGCTLQVEGLDQLDRWLALQSAPLPLGLGESYLDARLRKRFIASVGPASLRAAMDRSVDIDHSDPVDAVADRLKSGVSPQAKTPSPRWWSTVGATLGPFRRVIPPALVAWRALDAVLREIRDTLGRDELEHALTDLVDERKEKVKSALLGAVHDVRFRLWQEAAYPKVASATRKTATSCG